MQFHHAGPLGPSPRFASFTYRLAILAFALCALASFLPATTITFNGLTGTPQTYTEAEATFSIDSGGALFFSNNSPTGSTAMGAATVPFGNFRADFAGTVSMVSVDLGDLGGNDADELFLQVFSASNVLLGSDSDQIPAQVSTFRNLSVSAPGIAYAIFGMVGINGNSGVADNFTFTLEAEPGADVPEPGTASLLLCAASLFLIERRKRSAKLRRMSRSVAASTLAILAGTVFGLPASSSAATIFATTDTTIGSALPDTILGSSNTLTVTSIFWGLVRFDLSAYAGKVVTGPAILNLVYAGAPSGDTQGPAFTEAFQALSAWDENTTFDTFGSSAGVQSGEDFNPAALASFSSPGVFLNQTIGFAIAASVLQGWIDNASTNQGLLLQGSPALGAIYKSRETGTGFAPALTFEVEDAPPGGGGPGSDVPEPGTAALLIAGAALAAGRRTPWSLQSRTRPE